MKKEAKEEKKSENEKAKKSLWTIFLSFIKGILNLLEIVFVSLAILYLGRFVLYLFSSNIHVPFSFLEWVKSLRHLFVFESSFNIPEGKCYYEYLGATDDIRLFCSRVTFLLLFLEIIRSIYIKKFKKIIILLFLILVGLSIVTWRLDSGRDFMCDMDVNIESVFNKSSSSLEYNAEEMLDEVLKGKDLNKIQINQ